jgi:general secretion pathway protein D
MTRAMLNRIAVTALAVCLLGTTGCAGLPGGLQARPAAAVPEGGGDVPPAPPAPPPAPEPERAAPAPPPAASPSPAPPEARAEAPRGAPPAGTRAPAAPGGAEKYISLNFDNADISVVIQTVAELLKLNYIVAPGVRGRVTIQTSEKLPVSSLFAVLEQILELNALTAIKSGDFYKIVPSASAKQEALPTLSPDAAGSPPGTGLVTKIVQLRYISPAEVIKILTPFKTPAGLYQAHEPQRLLFLTEGPGKIAELMKIVEILDVDTFSSIQVELFPVRYAGVEDLAKELSQIVTMVYASVGRGKTLFRIVPVPSVNSIMVFSGETGLAENIRDWIAKLDQPATEANERIFVYPLSHATAETLAGVLGNVFRKESGKTSAKTTATSGTQPAAQPGLPGQPVRPAAPAAPAAAPAGGVADSIASGAAAPVTIVANKDTNALIIQTTSWYYPTVEATIRKLDLMPKQVLIEVLIAEILLDDTNQFGVQWTAKGQGGIGSEFFTSQTTAGPIGTVSPGGIAFAVTEANRISGMLKAFADANKINILSAPHIFAVDNKEAKIDVGEEVAIPKTRTTPTTSSGTGTVDNSITNDIEYRSTGVILTVTPHVNEGGFVTLDVQQEVSSAGAGNSFGPSIGKESVKTTMVVKDQQTLVIGGLIKQRLSTDRAGIPFLSRIPVVGALFGTTNDSVKKQELVLLITPRVVMNVEEGNRLTEELQDRVLTLKKGIEVFRKEIR